MRNVRLFWQIFPACVGITLLATVLIAWLATTTGHSFFLHHLEGEIRERALLLEPTITILSKGDPERFAEFVRQTGRRAATRITVIDRDGRVLADSSEDPQLMDNHGGRPEVAEALAGTTGYAVRPSRTVGESLLYAAVPVEVSEADRRGVGLIALHAWSDMGPVDFASMNWAPIEWRNIQDQEEEVLAERLCGYQDLHNVNRYKDSSMFAALKNYLWWTGGNVKK